MVNEKRKILLLLLLSFLVRAVLSACVELGDDEVYYRLYALYPDWSHFDHPPMVGWIIQLFSLNLLFDNEFAIRLGSVVIGTINTWIIYRMGTKLSNERAGWYAALLYTASGYCFVIVGLFIIPDTPLSLLWLLTMALFIELFSAEKRNRISSDRLMLLAGSLIGLGMLAKYTALFLWIGALLYILLYDRSWLKRWSLYVSGLVTILFFLPVIIWNVQNEFISFTFHQARVSVDERTTVNLLYFVKEIGGGFLYNNPISFVLFVAVLIALLRGKVWKENHSDVSTKLLLLFSLPIILTFWVISLFRDTLPHWGAPGYFGLMLIAAMFMVDTNRYTAWARWSVGFVMIGVFVAFVAIKTGFLPMQSPEDPKDMGAWDFTLSLYGMEQAGDQFVELHAKNVQSGEMPQDAAIIADKWFPAAHIDFYVAKPAGLTLLTLGSLADTHKFEWITRSRGGLQVGKDYYGIISSRFYRDIHQLYGDYFESISPADTITVSRMNKPVYQLLVYRLKHLKKLPESQIPE